MKSRTKPAKKSNTSKAGRPSPHSIQAKQSGLIRINKFIAMSGAASRRRADELIREGSVRVNGKTVSELGQFVNPDRDTIFVNNKPIRAVKDQVYVMLNKPPRVLTSMDEPSDRPSVKDFFVKARIRIFPIGKLDWDAEGLLLLTNDGEFAQKVSDPKNAVPKTYLVKLDAQATDDQLKKLIRGVSIRGGKIAALAARRMQTRGSEKYEWVKIIIAEGRNDQIRFMFSKLGLDVKKLQRIAIGNLKLANLEKGKFKILQPDDLKKVFQTPKELRED